MRSLLCLLALTVSASLPCSANNNVAGSSSTHTEAPTAPLIVEQVLSKYASYRQPSDPIAKEHPHLFEIEVKDVARVDRCSAWIAQAWVPTRQQPPYYEDNHHYEYWGISASASYFLGRGEYFALDQEIAAQRLADFIDDVCGGPLAVSAVASVYVRLALAGRMPFASAESAEPRMWHWVSETNELPDGWADEVQEVSAIPPAEFRIGRGVVFRGCVESQVGAEHSDVSCWSFRFDGNLRLSGVDQTYRRQTVPGFPNDLREGAATTGEND